MRFATVPFGVCFVAATLVRGAAAGTPPALDDVLRATREASGSPYLSHVRSLSHERIGDATFSITSESQGSRYLVKRCSQTICNGLYVDGERSSIVNINGTALPLPIDVDPLQSTLRAVATSAFAAPDFVTDGGRIGLKADGTADGVAVHRIVVATAHGAPLDVAIDATTHLVRTVSTQDGKIVFGFRDYRATSGMMLPYEIDVDGKRNQAFDRRERVDGTLEAPAGLVPAIGDARPANFATGRPPIVRCSIAGMTTSCLMDTGNSGMTMSPELAKRLGLKPLPSASLRGFGDALEGIVLAGPLSVAGAVYPSAAYSVVRGLHAEGAELALGADVFAHALVTIDYPAHAVSIAREGDGGGTLPITFENFVPITGAGIGTEVAPLAIDTGVADAVVVPQAFYVANRRLFASVATRADGDTTGGVAGIRIGSYVVARATVAATKLLTGGARGRLGSGLLAHFRTTFDYAHERIALEPRAGDASVTKAP